MEYSVLNVSVYVYVYAGPYLGTLRPWAQENLRPPLYLFVFSYVQLSNSLSSF